MIKLSRIQLGIIRRIAKKQEKSFMRIIINKQFDETYEALIEEGYDITITDVLDCITRFMLMWEEVREKPEKFMSILDDRNMGMVRDFLINDYGTDNFISPVLKGIHRRISLYEDLKRPNPKLN